MSIEYEIVLRGIRPLEFATLLGVASKVAEVVALGDRGAGLRWKGAGGDPRGESLALELEERRVSIAFHAGTARDRDALIAALLSVIPEEEVECVREL